MRNWQYFLLYFCSAATLCGCLDAQNNDSYRIVFDSNRRGNFGIYSVGLDGGEPKELIDSKYHDILPDVSKDGKFIVYARGKSAIGRNCDIWLANSDGSMPRLLVKNGNFPTFSTDGKTVYFEREQSKVMAFSIEKGEAREIFPLGLKPFFGKKVVLPRVSPDGTYLAFGSAYPRFWETWVINLQTKEFFNVGFGCEPVWNSDSTSFYWVTRENTKSKSGISYFDIATKSSKTVQDNGEPFGHEYFPNISDDGALLVWGACPGNQHSHETSNYQLFAREVATDTIRRITNDPHTNRWPKLMRVR